MKSLGLYKKNEDIVTKAELDSIWPFVFKNKIRLVRIYPGIISNAEGHVVEVRAFDKNGQNVALNKPAYFADGIKIGTRYGAKRDSTTDGDLSALNYTHLIKTGYDFYFTIDLGDWYEIKSINLLQYYSDGRTYKNVKIAVGQSPDNFYKIFDSNIDGEYAEKYAGKTVAIPDNWQEGERI